MAAAPFDPAAVRAFEHARWERAATVYSATFAHATAPFIEPLLDAAAVGRGTRLLDVACGPGFVASSAARRGALSSGVDFSAAMVAAAKANSPELQFAEADAEALPHADATFDAAVANFGIHHVPHPLLALREAHRVLREGGSVAFSFWAEPGENIAWQLVFDAVARHGDRSAAQAPPPGGGFDTPAQCAEALGRAGFSRPTTRLVRATWHHRSAQDLVAALQAGTARMAAMLEAQRPGARSAIIADITDQAEQYRGTNGIAVPIAAVIASGLKV